MVLTTSIATMQDSDSLHRHKMEKYMVIVVQAFDHEAPGGSLINVTSIELMENKPDVALKRAKALIERKHYRISNIVENYVKS